MIVRYRVSLCRIVVLESFCDVHVSPLIQDGGEIDLTLSRRKRRVNDEYETALERVKRLLEEQAILSARYLHGSGHSFCL